MTTRYLSIADYRSEWEAGSAPDLRHPIVVAVERADSVTNTVGSTVLSDTFGIDIVGLVSLDGEFTAGHSRLSRLIITTPGGFPLSLLVVALLPAASFPGLADSARIREAAMVAATNSKGQNVDSFLAVRDDGSDAATVAAAISGHRYGAFEFTPEPATRLRLVLACDDSSVDRTRLDQTLSDAESRADSINWVRRLAETPGNLLTPGDFADEIVRRAQSTDSAAKLTATVWEGQELRERGFGATLAVGGGSAHPPRVVELVAGDGNGPWLGLVGKGITYDSGGINIKQDMHEAAWMKSDMAAAAALAAAVIEAARLNPSLRVRAIFPIAENMPGAGAGRPGDVVTHPGGETTEVIDTDCEGRLILADGLSWLRLNGAAAMIDAGTLTDSGGVGQAYWGTWSTDDSLVNGLITAGAAAEDPGWRLPLHPLYAGTLESGVADIRNASLDQPDSGQLAATYLRHFVGEIPWAHLDIGAGAYLEHEHGEWRIGATGSPAAALTAFLSTRD
jgi:leucyl aminopeptidase